MDLYLALFLKKKKSPFCGYFSKCDFDSIP